MENRESTREAGSVGEDPNRKKKKKTYLFVRHLPVRRDRLPLDVGEAGVTRRTAERRGVRTFRCNLRREILSHARRDRTRHSRAGLFFYQRLFRSLAGSPMRNETRARRK